MSKCLDPRLCLFLETQFPGDLEGGCFYPDYTLAETGILPQVGDCASLPEGLCSVDCPCPEDDARSVCYGLSEARPVGACALAGGCAEEAWIGPCLTGRDDTCLRAADPPPWTGEEFAFLAGGRCTTPANCEALAERYPGVWRCERN